MVVLNIQKWMLVVALLVGIVGCGGSKKVSSEVITSASPVNVDVNGGEVSTIKGNNFIVGANYKVVINGIEAGDVTVIDAQTIEVIAPEAEARESITLVLMRDTMALGTLIDVLEYVGDFNLSIASVSPNNINSEGGDRVSIYGKGFSEEMSVFIDNTYYDYLYIDENRISVQTGKGTIDTVSELRIVSGDETQIFSSAFTYVDKRLRVSEIKPNTGYNIGGETIKIYGKNFSPSNEVFFGTEPVQLVQFISSSELSVIAPTQFIGVVELNVTNSKKEVGHSTYIYTEAPAELNPAPYVVSAHALDNTHVLLNFSEPMAYDTGTVDLYSIYGDENAATLLIKSIAFKSQTLIELTTFPMSEISYSVKVNGVKDRSGKPILAESRENDFGSAPFKGIGESVTAGETETDSDGDGLSDAVEQRGFVISYTLTSGEVRTESVTSDPRVTDTDGDGMSDYDEYAASTNPRSTDTDKDTLNDDQEYNVYLSDPLKQDTDDDGLNDVTELGYGTSLVLADTDGDQ
ncbi:MAG: IPT/TIG domain-containing protein, partial [Campylobacterota bacterium]